MAGDSGPAWRLDWSVCSQPDREGWLAALPENALFRTSGSSGEPQRWWRTKSQLLAEIEIVRGLLPPEPVDEVVSFAPISHLYGFLFTALFPAVVGVPVRYEPPGPDASFVRSPISRPLFVMIPSAWAVLQRDLAGGLRLDAAVALHSTAVLPSTARSLLTSSLGRGLTAIELFGSTETGLVAVRQATGELNADWHLATDVQFSGMAQDGREEQLGVSSPRLATVEGAGTPSSVTLDDWVRVRGARTFQFAGRRTRIVNVNGRRLNLDALEEKLRADVPCADLACMPVIHDTQGEHFELLVVPLPARTLDVAELRRVVRAAIPAPRPRRIHLVGTIDRSATGKLRRLQATPPP